MTVGPPLEIRFWQKVRKSDGCWEWQAHRFRTGYGALRISGKTETAHRVSYRLNVGPIPEGLWVLHRCDNPGCVRPDHLFLGTRLDNVADMDAKGRRTQAILTVADVQEIRARAEMLPRTRSGKRKMGSMIQLAAEYGVSKGTIKYVVARKLWRHVV